MQNSLDGINQLNKNRTNASALYGLTKYSDLSIQDFYKYLVPNFRNYQGKIKNKIPKVNKGYSDRLQIPKKVDWREKKVVTRVQNQGTCGACWAFAAIEITESMNAIKTGKLESYSIQEMIDCAENNDGCDGGDLYLLLDWLKTENVSIVTETEYPTKLVDGDCKRTGSPGIQVKDFQCGK